MTPTEYLEASLRRDLDEYISGHRPIVPPADLGVRIPRKGPRVMSAQEAFSHLDKRDSVLSNFIPQMLTALAMQKATELVEYCRDNRLKEYVKHTRVIKTAAEDYAVSLFRSYGSAPMEAYRHYVERYFTVVAGDVHLLMLEAEFQARHQFPKCDSVVAALACVVQMLIAYVVKFEEEVDKRLGQALGCSCRAQRDKNMLAVSAMCIAIAEDWGMKISPSVDMAKWVQILSNKAHLLAVKIMEEEN